MEKLKKAADSMSSRKKIFILICLICAACAIGGMLSHYLVSQAATTYTITYKSSDGKTLGTQKKTKGTDVNAWAASKAGTKTGYTFSKWKSSVGGGTNGYYKAGQVIGTNQNQTLTATWNANTYTVVYDDNGKFVDSSGDSFHANLTASDTCTYDEAFTVSKSIPNWSDEDTAVLPDGVKSFYWNTKQDGTGTSYQAGASVKNLTAVKGGTVTLYAQLNTAKIYYSDNNCLFTDPDGESHAVMNGSSQKATGADLTEKIKILDVNDCKWIKSSEGTSTSAYPKSGKKLIGWTGYSDAASGNIKVLKPGESWNLPSLQFEANNQLSDMTKDITLYAQVGQTLRFSYISPQDVIDHSAYHNQVDTPSRGGYRFLGWYDAETGGEKVYDASGSYVSGTYWNSAGKWENSTHNSASGELRLYAHWQKVSYGVKFYSNGGKGKTDSKEYRYDVSYNLPANGFTKKGKKFTGWKVQSVTDPDGKTVTGSAASVVGNTYRDKASVKNLTDMDGYVVNLYAQWADSDSVNITSGTSEYSGKVSIANSFQSDSQGRYEKSYSLANGTSLIFEGLPSNTGQLTEELGTEGFTPYFNVTKGNPAGSTSGKSKTGKSLSTGQSTLNEDTTYQYTNYKNEVKDIKVDKAFLPGEEGNPDDAFRFAARFANLEESGTYYYRLYKLNDDGNLEETSDSSGSKFTTSDSGSAKVEFTLKANEYVIFSALPADGMMSVTEFANEYRTMAGYSNTTDVKTSGQDLETKSTSVAALYNRQYGSQNANIHFTNLNLSQLCVTKKVAGNRADKSKKFTFTASFTGLHPGTTYSTETGSASGTFTADSSGRATVQFAIEADESFSVSSLPHGAKYTIHENSDGYEKVYEVTEGEGYTNGESGTISANKKISYTYTNRKQTDYTDKALRVEKKIAGSAASTDDSFLYHLSLTGLEASTKYALKLNGSDQYDLTYDTGSKSIQVTKTTEAGTTSDATADVPVIVTEMDTKGNKTLRWAGGTAELSKDGDLTGSLTYEGGLQTFTSDSSGNASSVSVSLKAGESFTLDTVPKGTKYQITEAAKDGYTPKYESSGNGENESDELSANAPAGNSLSVPQQTLDKDITFTFTNSKFKRKTLQVSKAIEGDAADPSDVFSIDLHIKDAEPNAKYVAVDDASIILTSDAKGNIDKTLKLKGGQSHTFNTLPDSCTVWTSEGASAGYVPAYKVSSFIDSGAETEVDAGSGFIGLDLDTGSYELSSNTHIAYTNKKSLKNDLMIRKDSVGVGRDKNDEFTFSVTFKGLKENTQYQVIKESIETIAADPDDEESVDEEKRTQIDTARFTSGVDGTATYTVKLKASQEITIKGLPNTAVYRVTEKGNGYTPSYKETKGSDEFHYIYYSESDDEDDKDEEDSVKVEKGVYGSGEKNKDLSTDHLALDMDTELTFTNQKDTELPEKSVSDTDNITKDGEGEEKDVTENTVESKKSKWTYTITQVCPDPSNGDDGKESEGLLLEDSLPDLITTNSGSIGVTVNGKDVSSDWTREVETDEFGTRVYVYSNDGVTYQKGDVVCFTITAWLDQNVTAAELSSAELTDDGFYYIFENTANVYNGYTNFDTNTVRTNVPKETTGFTVSKNVKGNLGDRTKSFEFTANFSGLEKNKSYTGRRNPEFGYYYVSLSDGKIIFSAKDRNGNPVKGIEADFDADGEDGFALVTGSDGTAESRITCGEWQYVVSTDDVPNVSTVGNVTVSGKAGENATADSILAGETTKQIRISQGKAFTVTADSNGNASFTQKLKDDESYTISALPIGATYSVSEAASDHVASFSMTRGAENVKTKSKKNDKNNTSLSTGTETLNGAAGYAFTNTRNLAPPSGVNGTSVLLWIFIGAAAGTAAYLIRRRRVTIDH